MADRRDDARLDAQIHDNVLRSLGVIDEDEPTEASHAAWMAEYRRTMGAEFTPGERAQIRTLLGIGVRRV